MPYSVSKLYIYPYANVRLVSPKILLALFSFVLMCSSNERVLCMMTAMSFSLSVYFKLVPPKL